MNQLHCDIVQDLLVAYFDGEVSPGTRLAIEKHLTGCATCRQLLKDMEVSPMVFQGLAPTPPPGDRERRVLAAARRRLYVMALGIFLIAAGVLGFTGWGLYQLFITPDVPWLVRLGIAAPVGGVLLIVMALIAERRQDRKEEEDDLGKY